MSQIARNPTATALPLDLETTKGRMRLGSAAPHHTLVYFMREFNCAMCISHVQRLVRLYPQLQAKQTEVVIVGGGSVEQAERFAARFKLPFAVAADRDHHLYDAFALNRTFGIWQSSGTVIADRTGKIRYTHGTMNPASGLLEGQVMEELAALQ